MNDEHTKEKIQIDELLQRLSISPEDDKTLEEEELIAVKISESVGARALFHGEEDFAQNHDSTYSGVCLQTEQHANESRFPEMLLLSKDADRGCPNSKVVVVDATECEGVHLLLKEINGEAIRPEKNCSSDVDTCLLSTEDIEVGGKSVQLGLGCVAGNGLLSTEVSRKCSIDLCVGKGELMPVVASPTKEASTENGCTQIQQKFSVHTDGNMGHILEDQNESPKVKQKVLKRKRDARNKAKELISRALVFDGPNKKVKLGCSSQMDNIVADLEKPRDREER